MPISFKCPSCSAPLDYEGKMMQKCRFCGSNIIVPSSAIQDSSAFGGFGNLDFGDLSSLTGKAFKIAEIQRLIQNKQKIQAIKVFRKTFGGGLKEAKDAVDAMEDGKSVDVSGMRVQAQKFHATPLNAQNLEAVKKAGKIIGGTLLSAIIISAILILITVGGIIYSFVRTTEKIANDLPTSNSNAQMPEKEKPKLADEVLKFGGEGTGAGKFKDNRNVAIDRASGRIYSGDYNGGKIQVFDGEGKYLTQWTAERQANLYDMVADRKGNLFILQNRGIFLHEGESGKVLAHLKDVRAEGLALTLDGKLVATTRMGLTIYDANLNVVQEFKDAAEKASSVFGFEGVAVDGNNQIYAVDRQGSGAICKFAADGKFLNRFKLNSTSPNTIAVDSKGRIFVSEASKINVFNAEDGKFLDSFKTNQAFGMAFNDADELFVASRPFVVKYKINF